LSIIKKEEKMAKRYTRKEIIERLKAEIEKGRPLFMPNCGCGLTAKLQEMGGADLITVSPTSYWRMKGLPSAAVTQPYIDINEVIFTLAPEITANVKETPIISLSGPGNPLLPHKKHLKKLWELDISGVTPLMSRGVGPAGTGLSALLDGTGMGFEAEVEFVRVAHEMEMFTFAYAYSPEEAKTFAEAGADVISAHVGTTAGGLVGAKTALTLVETVKIEQKIFDAALAINKDIILFVHGGPIVTPEDAAYAIKNSDAVGFVGGSAAERMPIEKAVLEATKNFKNFQL
jgi:predicted TIM-barrel enzyme